METKVKIIKDTVSHRIPIGNIVRIKGNYEIRKNKKCYNVADFACYISTDDFEIIDGDKIIDEKPNDISTTEKERSMMNWFDDYAKSHTTPKYSKGQKVKVINMYQLEPNGKTTIAPDGVYTIYETLDKKGNYWFRSDNPNDVNEYFCTEESIMGIVMGAKSDSRETIKTLISRLPSQPKPRKVYNTSGFDDFNFDVGDDFLK